MPVTGTPRSYDKKFLFAVEIDGLDVAWFEMISGLEVEIGVVEQHEGGDINVADQSPGKAKFAPVTLSVGSTDNEDLYNWWLEVCDAASNSGEVDAQYKKNVAIVQRDRDQSEKRRWTLYEAWPSKYKAGEWDAKAEENVIEEVTLTYKRFDRKKG
jgi:phage tail-like protein